MEASIWVMFITKNSDTCLIERLVCTTPLLLFSTMDFISGQLIPLTNPIHRILGQFVNKPGKKLFCNRALLKDNQYDSANDNQYTLGLYQRLSHIGYTDL